MSSSQHRASSAPTSSAPSSSSSPAIRSYSSVAGSRSRTPAVKKALPPVFLKVLEEKFEYFFDKSQKTASLLEEIADHRTPDLVIKFFGFDRRGYISSDKLIEGVADLLALKNIAVADKAVFTNCCHVWLEDPSSIASGYLREPNQRVTFKKMYGCSYHVSVLPRKEISIVHISGIGPRTTDKELDFIIFKVLEFPRDDIVGMIERLKNGSGTLDGRVSISYSKPPISLIEKVLASNFRPIRFCNQDLSFKFLETPYSSRCPYDGLPHACRDCPLPEKFPEIFQKMDRVDLECEDFRQELYSVTSSSTPLKRKEEKKEEEGKERKEESKKESKKKVDQERGILNKGTEGKEIVEKKEGKEERKEEEIKDAILVESTSDSESTEEGRESISVQYDDSDIKEENIEILKEGQNNRNSRLEKYDRLKKEIASLESERDSINITINSTSVLMKGNGNRKERDNLKKLNGKKAQIEEKIDESSRSLKELGITIE